MREVLGDRDLGAGQSALSTRPFTTWPTPQPMCELINVHAGGGARLFFFFTIHVRYCALEFSEEIQSSPPPADAWGMNL